MGCNVFDVEKSPLSLSPWQNQRFDIPLVSSVRVGRELWLELVTALEIEDTCCEEVTRRSTIQMQDAADHN